MKLHMALGSRHVYQLTCNTERSGMLGDGSGVSEVSQRVQGNQGSQHISWFPVSWGSGWIQ